MSVTTAPAGRRVRVLDGIRGFAIILVLLSHTWIVAPVSDIDDRALQVLMSSGNYAVSIFFVVGGFLATRGMLREVDRRGSLRPGVTWVRRWIRISAHVYPLVIAVLALTAVDQNMVAYKLNNTRESAWHIITYTWNGYVRTHPLEARPDLGHLWYVCTDIWTVGFIALLVFVLGRRRQVLLLALAASVLVVMLYREHVYQTEGLFPALTRVQTRADGLLWGAMAAVALPWLRGLAPRAQALNLLSVVALVPLMWAVNDSADYFGFAGWLLNLDLAVLVVTTSLAEPRRVVQRVVGWAPLELVGRYSLVLYIWHYPIFFYLSRNTLDWSWPWRTLVGYGLTVAIAVVTQRLIERPLQRWLSSPSWRAVDDGFPTAIRRKVRGEVAKVRSGA
jgi:peptidoglycan/LPS O-acetylase OafA/YrhL